MNAEIRGEKRLIGGEQVTGAGDLRAGGEATPTLDSDMHPTAKGRRTSLSMLSLISSAAVSLSVEEGMVSK